MLNGPGIAYGVKYHAFACTNRCQLLCVLIGVQYIIKREMVWRWPCRLWKRLKCEVRVIPVQHICHKMPYSRQRIAKPARRRSWRLWGCTLLIAIAGRLPTTASHSLTGATPLIAARAHLLRPIRIATGAALVTGGKNALIRVATAALIVGRKNALTLVVIRHNSCSFPATVS
jgi:hypothetical protein